MRRQIGWLAVFLSAHASAFAQSDATLAWKFRPGETLYVETVTARKQSLESMGKSLNKTAETTTTVTALKVKETSPRGTVLQITIEGRKIDAGTDKQRQESDAKLAEKLKGSVFTVTLNQAGKITKFDGYDDLIKKLAGGNEELEKQARAGLTEEGLKKSIEGTFASLPGRPVAKGDSWKHESMESLGPLGAFKVLKTFTYDGQENGADRVTVQAIRTYVPPSGDGGLVKVTKGSLKAEKAQESFLFDSANGRLVRGETHVVIRGSLTIEYMNEQQALEAWVDETVTIRVLSKNPLAK